MQISDVRPGRDRYLRRLPGHAVMLTDLPCPGRSLLARAPAQTSQAVRRPACRQPAAPVGLPETPVRGSTRSQACSARWAAATPARSPCAGPKPARRWRHAMPARRTGPLVAPTNELDANVVIPWSDQTPLLVQLTWAKSLSVMSGR